MSYCNESLDRFSWRSARRSPATKQHPARGNVLVAVVRRVAAVGVREGGRRDEQRASLGYDSALLVQELGFALAEVIVEVDRPQHHAVQRFTLILGARVEFAMPIR